jgi:membrane protein implicated in regulation of membrane protease activity
MWSLGILIGIPVLLLIVIPLIVLIVISFTKEFHESYGWSSWGLVRVWASVVLVLVLLFAAAAYYPWKAEYHKWETTSGTITQVDSRLLGGDNNVTERFVVRFDNGALRACDDTRCALLEEGDHLTLKCKRHWQFAGEDGYDCNYVRSRRA